MDFKLLAVAVCFLFSLAHGQHDHQNHAEHRVNVAVYYESLCPDSRKFITQQLYPSLQGNLSKFVNLTLVPYGKTTVKFELNEHKFTCHHGPNECYGNKIQACALKLIDGEQNSKDLGYNKVSAGFINCLMDRATKNDTHANFPTKQCAELNNVHDLLSIENCANHTDGSNYLSVLGKMTDDVQNPLTSVPTIVFNRKYSKDDSSLAQTNFVKALCQYIQGDKPVECSRNGAQTLTASVVFLVIVSLASPFFY